MRILFLAFDGLTLQDLVGAHEVLWRAPETEALVCGVRDSRIVTDGGIAIECGTVLDRVDSCDMVLVPGGPGIDRLLSDDDCLARLRALGEAAQYVTSVCTGALVLGAAGLLNGYRAATHWRYRDLLRECGAIPVDERVVRDRNRITGGGVTAGIDLALKSWNSSGVASGPRQSRC